VLHNSQIAVRYVTLAFLLGIGLGSASIAHADNAAPAAKPAAAAPAAAASTDVKATDDANFKPAGKAVSMQENGMWVDKDGNPTDRINNDGTLDWFSFSGYRRYHSECHVCHGPDAMGSSYAPALKDSVKAMSYADFLGTVAAGRQNVTTSQNNVMPSFGNNKNVMCYINDIYVYLIARSNGDLDRARPEKHLPKPKPYADAETACIGF
jgi:methanol metabolism-related c-type cytochrome